jgi:hypothetical protein
MGNARTITVEHPTGEFAVDPKGPGSVGTATTALAAG